MWRTWLVTQLVLAAALAMLVGYFFRSSIHDYIQYDSDAYEFFSAASGSSISGVQLDEWLLLTENILPITAWGWMYSIARVFGLEEDPFWGILLNAALVITAELIALSYARRKFCFDSYALTYMALVMSVNGLFLMFAGIHMRDSFLLLLSVISVITFHPAEGLINISSYLRRLPVLLLLCVLSFLCRTESFVIPVLAFSISAAFSLKHSPASVKITLVVLVICAVAILFSLDIVKLIMDNYEQYQMLSADENQGESLAYALIYEVPFPISTIMSSTLLLFVKFPFWKSMLYDSYTFYVSLAALQMIFIAPIFVCVALYCAFNFRDVARPYAYLLAIVTAVLLMTAVTSNQVRHFAIVYPFFFILCLSRRRIITSSQLGIYRTLQYSLSCGALLVSALAGLRG